MAQTATQSGTSKLALHGAPRTVELSPPAWPVVSEKEVERMAEVVRTGKWSWVGEHERAFCEEYAAFIGADYCAAMSNGTVTLQCALQAVGVLPVDEVIVPGLTWVATVQSALDVGADVVLVDIDQETLCLDPGAFEAAITPRTRAVIPVHLYGCMCDMDAIMAIARKHDIKVVEDVAHFIANLTAYPDRTMAQRKFVLDCFRECQSLWPVWSPDHEHNGRRCWDRLGAAKGHTND